MNGLTKQPLQPFPSKKPVGRFAPSPTGVLHFGSLATAVASYCHIKSMAGTWFLRIEDTDTQRCHPNFSNQILTDLYNLGLHWDNEVIYQSQRTKLYNQYIHDELHMLCYACECSRKDLKRQFIYPRNCLHKSLDLNKHKIRIQLPNHMIGFFDGVQGMQWQNPQKTLGDMVIRRDSNNYNMINYILAVSIDDGLQGITHAMRGLDIMPMTSAQIAIMQLAKLPAIDYWYHLPLVLNNKGQKLSKQNLAKPIDTSNEHKCSELLATALDFLQQANVDIDTPERMLAQAVKQWDTRVLTVKN
ncbi:MAG: tRNA glutamyl-Q(34) synthetase GluQRS [Gammaproteobacteria bacterium]|nr:MAG: tRNA glutamyl-Q(34) synthetase GluQRS [Gammaproteobacteria bacterium]